MSDYKEATIGAVLRETMEKFPEHEALVFPDTGLRQNYTEFYAACREAAKGFMAIGVKKGDHVSVWTTNLPEWVYIQFGLS